MVNTCPNCGEPNLNWDSDADAEEVGYVIQGIVSYCHCTHCGAFIEVLIPAENEYEKENEHE